MSKENNQKKRMSDEWSDCIVCSSSFQQPRYRKKKYCSATCMGQKYAQEAKVAITCEQCGKEKEVKGSEAAKGTKYCSTECYHESRIGITLPMNTLGEAKCAICQNTFKKIKQTSVYCSNKCYGESKKKPKYCPCGKETKTSQSKYCSDDCVNQYGKVKARKPEKDYVCFGCGEIFKRYESYTSKKMYCSNECSTREQKKGFGKTGVITPDGLLILRSFYEMRFAAACERFGISWRSYDKEPIVVSVGNYYPDFIITINGIDRIVEIKGWLDDKSKLKMMESELAGINILLVNKAILESFEVNGVLPV